MSHCKRNHKRWWCLVMSDDCQCCIWICIKTETIFKKIFIPSNTVRHRYFQWCHWRVYKLKFSFRYSAMIACWQDSPDERPTFTKLCEEISDVLQAEAGHVSWFKYILNFTDTCWVKLLQVSFKHGRLSCNGDNIHNVFSCPIRKLDSF